MWICTFNHVFLLLFISSVFDLGSGFNSHNAAFRLGKRSFLSPVRPTVLSNPNKCCAKNFPRYSSAPLTATEIKVSSSSNVTEPIDSSDEVKQLDDSNPPNKATDFLSGIVIALANVPSSVAFANIAGVNPLIGIWSSFSLGLVSAVYGGRPGLIAGAASAVCVPLSKISIPYGVQYMHATVMLSALLQASFSLLKLGNLISYVTNAAVFGFLNGLGLVIAKSQIKVFSSLTGMSLYSSLGLALSTAAGINIIPKYTKALPSSLIALVIATVFSQIASLPVERLVDVAGKSTFAGGLSVLPKFVGLFPAIPFTLETFKMIAPVAFSMALITFLQSLLASKVVESSEKICTIPKTDNDRVIMGVALGNALSGVLGGHGGCGLLPFTVLNVQNGGRGTLSSVTAALALGIFVVIAAPLIGVVPLPALAGLMFTVAWSTFKLEPSVKMAKAAFKKTGTWNERLDFVVLAISSLICYKVDMALGILTGIGITQIGNKLHHRLEENKVEQKPELEQEVELEQELQPEQDSKLEQDNKD